jgi:hypothetical protein
MGENDAAKWKRFPLKSRWYDDHFGDGAPRGDVVENRLRRLDERVLSRDEDDVASREVERFFDLFEPGG